MTDGNERGCSVCHRHVLDGYVGGGTSKRCPSCEADNVRRRVAAAYIPETVVDRVEREALANANRSYSQLARTLNMPTDLVKRADVWANKRRVLNWHRGLQGLPKLSHGDLALLMRDRAA